MASGVVKVWKREQGFGFIKNDDGTADVYLHIVDLKKEGFQGEPAAGDRLTFEIATTERGLRAAQVKRA